MPQNNPRPAFFKNWLAWLGIGLGTLIAHLPWACYKPLSWILSFLMRNLMISRGRIALRNIQLCFPELTDAQQKKLWRDSFDSLAFSAFEFARGWWGNLRSQEIMQPINGLHHLQAATNAGKGVILVSPHLTTLEYCNKILAQHVRMAAMYRPFDSEVLEWSVLNGRLKIGSMFKRDELRASLRYLKSGGILWFAADQETRRGESVFVPFFKQQAFSLTSTHQMAKLSKASVHTFFHQRLPDGSYTIEISAALENFPSEDPVQDTARVMGLFEQMIRRCPEQYLWLHARFKRQPDGKSLYQSTNT
ncbi:MAG: lipid A biosynthesis lauroyl acyltransferase [Arenimonas sp.]|nr:lipid A biosynthesis lauroyl acyltransferase [Arenimonas sp.]